MLKLKFQRAVVKLYHKGQLLPGLRPTYYNFKISNTYFIQKKLWEIRVHVLVLQEQSQLFNISLYGDVRIAITEIRVWGGEKSNMGRTETWAWGEAEDRAKAVDTPSQYKMCIVYFIR